MWNRLRRFNALPRDARGLFVRAAVLLPLVSVSLRLRGFRATQASLATRISSGWIHNSVQTDCDGQVRICVRMVNAAARHLWPCATCLEKSLTLAHLLQRRGLESTLRIGARTTRGEFEAHAWVELDGVAINESDDDGGQYAAFALPAAEQP